MRVRPKSRCTADIEVESSGHPSLLSDGVHLIGAEPADLSAVLSYLLQALRDEVCKQYSSITTDDVTILAPEEVCGLFLRSVLGN